MAYKILIADDEVEILETLDIYLEKEGYEVFKAEDGLSAWKLVQTKEIDLAIIDIMMPIIDGYKLIKMIRENYNIPVIMLSAKNQDSDKILGLGLGADDYVSKPFNPLEVIARTNAQIRRFYDLNIGNDKSKSIISVGDIEFDSYNSTVKRNNNEVVLTSVEFKILKVLMENAGRILTKKEIYESVWEDHFLGDDNIIMVHMSNLRDKIEEDSRKPRYIKTVRGLGYKFEKRIAEDEKK